MVLVSWYGVVHLGGAAPGGDMVGHAAGAEWLRTLQWWDWRGWSDWFYGGQALGVSYPPLGSALMRFSHVVHGQMALVAVGLLVLLPWGALRLARAVGFGPRAQQAAVASVLVLAAASGDMHWVLSGFHSERTFFGSWPAMLAVAVSLFVAAWAARCARPVAAGAVAGLAVLLNASVVPGMAVACLALLASSGASVRQSVRWAGAAAASGAVTCAWWLVPFVAGWDRLVRFDVPLSEAWRTGGVWQSAILAGLGMAAAWAAVSGVDGPRRLAVAAGLGLAATVVADLSGYLRSERWLEVPILMAALAAAGLASARSPGRPSPRPPYRISIAALVVAFAVVLVASAGLWEAVPLAAWTLLGQWRSQPWAWGGALAWSVLLLWVPVSERTRNPPQPRADQGTVLETVTALSGPHAEGTLYLDRYYNTTSGDVGVCEWIDPWRTTVQTDGRIRSLEGLYGTTSATAEFTLAEQRLRSGVWHQASTRRPHWFDAWLAGGERSLDSTAAAEAMGARWYGQCDAEGSFTVSEGPGTAAEGVTVAPYGDEESWHRAAVQWWVAVASEMAPLRPIGTAEVPVLWPGADDEGEAALVDQAARGVSLRSEQDRLLVTAESAGWAWVRVPWDPWWFGSDGVPLKGGPGHMVVWVEPGVTEMRWYVPGRVDAMAAGVTALSLLLLLAMASINRREGWVVDPDRPRPAADAVSRFADAADRRLLAAGRLVRSGSHRALPGSRRPPNRKGSGAGDDVSGDQP